MALKKKSLFSQIIILIIISIICIMLTLAIAFLVGSAKTDIIDFSSLNISNMIPVLIVGGFITCVIIGIIVLFLAKTVFFKVKDYFHEKNNGGNEK